MPSARSFVLFVPFSRGDVGVKYFVPSKKTTFEKLVSVTNPFLIINISSALDL